MFVIFGKDETEQSSSATRTVYIFIQPFCYKQDLTHSQLLNRVL